jgi:hypothetical protein
MIRAGTIGARVLLTTANRSASLVMNDVPPEIFRSRGWKMPPAGWLVLGVFLAVIAASATLVMTVP